MCHELASFEAPHDHIGERGLPPGLSPTDPAFWKQYHNTTLIYDSVWLSAEKTLRLYCPKLISFKEKLLSAEFLIDGQPAKIKRVHETKRFDMIDFFADELPSQLSMRLGADVLPLPLSPCAGHRFKGKNVLYTMVKNDELDWIVDWIAAHHRNHGANAVLVANNGSDRYSREELRIAISAVPGIEVADVLEVPQRYGPTQSVGQKASAANYLQVACLNIVRDRFFRDARAVLVCDVDELVTTSAEEGIFDRTVESLSQYVSFSGSWRFVSPSKTHPMHADHTYSDQTQADCPTKYCIVPNSFFGRFTWAVHSLEKVNRKLYPRSRNFHYYHCRSINTSWKYNRAQSTQSHLELDETTANFMDRTFRNATT